MYMETEVQRSESSIQDTYADNLNKVKGPLNAVIIPSNL